MINSVFTSPISKWGIVPDGAEVETPSSWLLPVRNASSLAMLKVYKPASDERNGSDYLKYLGGIGAVRVLEADGSALLMERATGSRSLKNMVVDGEDDRASEILADTISLLHAPRSDSAPKSLIPLELQFASLFKRANEHPLLNLAATTAQDLLRRQRDVIPLHGDLHHSNVLDGGSRGWLAIDPKALIGDRTYEVANVLANPWPHSDIVHSTDRVARLANHYATRLEMDAGRILAFGLAHAGLSACWDLDDGFDPQYRFRCIEMIRPLV